MGVRTEKMEKWQNHMDAAAVFPGTFQYYCQDHGLSISTFQYWRKKLSNTKERAAAPAFVPIKLWAPKAPLPEAQWVAEVLAHLIRGLS